MIIEEEEVKQGRGNKPNLPIIQAWLGVNMIRIHSLRATINEILQFAASLDVVRIGIIGNPATGKSTLGETIAHLIHKMAKIPFAIKIFDKNNLINFRETLKDLIPTNYILIFDDVSFLGANATKKQIEIIKQAVTEIRHLPGGRDVKIIIIMNYHYTLGLDKYLRQADFRYFTSVGSSELENMEKIVHGKNMVKVLQFQKLFQDAIVKGKFSFRLKKGSFSYDYRKPFIPLLFFNNNTLRFIVSPTRYWIDKVCNTCTQAQNDVRSPNSKPIEELMKEGEAKFGRGAWIASIKIALFKHGINVYTSKISRSGKWLDQGFSKGLYRLEDIVAYYGFTITRSRLDKTLKDILSDEQEAKPEEEKPIEVK